MRNILSLAGFAFLLGCAPTLQQPSSAYIAYKEAQKLRADAGEITYSRLYADLYERAKAEGAPPGALSNLAEILFVANRHDAGDLTKEQFLQERDRLNAAYQLRAQEFNQKQRLIAATETQNAVSAFLGGLAAGAAAYNAGYNSARPYQSNLVDYEWDWDQYRDAAYQLVWACRGVQTGQFADAYRCSYKAQTDWRWPQK